MGLSEMPEEFKPLHAINDSFRPRTTCVHFEKEKKQNNQYLSCHIVIYSVNVLHSPEHTATSNARHKS